MSRPLAKSAFLFLYLNLNLPSASVFRKDIDGTFTRSFCLYLPAYRYRCYLFIAAQVAEFFTMGCCKLLFALVIQDSFGTERYDAALFQRVGCFLQLNVLDVGIFHAVLPCDVDGQCFGKGTLFAIFPFPCHDIQFEVLCGIQFFTVYLFDGNLRLFATLYLIQRSGAEALTTILHIDTVAVGSCYPAP